MRPPVFARLLVIVIALVCVFAPPGTRAQRADPYGESAAAMLQKIASFVRWPDSAEQKRPEAHFVITVLGDSPVLTPLVSLYAKPNAGALPAVVRSVKRREQVGNTHVLFITQAFSEQLSEILEQIGDSPTLTVGDAPGFAARGMAVNLYREGGRVRFEINRRALERHHLHASYQLLSLARLVEGL